MSKELTAKSLLEEVRQLRASEDPVVVIAQVLSGNISYTRSEILSMLDEKGNVRQGAKYGDNLPKWIWVKGYSKKMGVDYGGSSTWIQDPEAKEFLKPFGMRPWRKLNDKAFKKVGEILQILSKRDKPIKLDVRST